MRERKIIVLSSTKKFWLGIVAPIIVIAAMLSAAATQTGCGGAGGGLFPTVNPSASPTPTNVPFTGVFLYSTNIGDGKVAEFQRNTSTGALGLFGTVSAGAFNSNPDGPRGIVITPNKQFVYVANSADGNVYEYQIQSNTGGLLLIGSISANSGSSTASLQQVVTDTTGSFLYVSNFGGGAYGPAILIYTINSSSGALTFFGRFTGPAGPKGMTVSGSELFVADYTSGTLWPLAINSSTGALSLMASPVSSPDNFHNGNPIQLLVNGSNLYVTDFEFGVVSLFVILSNGGLSFGSSAVSGSTTPSQPVGLGAATANSTNYVFSANVDSISEFASAGAILTRLSAQVSTAQGPFGVAVDPQQKFLYSANTQDGTIGLFQVGVNCPNVFEPLCPITSYSTESSNSNPHYIAMTN